jgi:hypothetical protein
MPTSRSERLREIVRSLATTGEFEDSAAVARRLDLDGHPDAIGLFSDTAFTREIDRLCRASRRRAARIETATKQSRVSVLGQRTSSIQIPRLAYPLHCGQ